MCLLYVSFLTDLSFNFGNSSYKLKFRGCSNRKLLLVAAGRSSSKIQSDLVSTQKILIFVYFSRSCLQFMQNFTDPDFDLYNSSYKQIFVPWSASTEPEYFISLAKFKNSLRLRLKSKNSKFQICYSHICLVYLEFFGFIF